MPEPLRVPAQNGLSCFAPTTIEVLFYDFYCASEGTRNQTHGPVRTDHKAVRAEGIEHNVEIRCDLRRSPMLPVRFRHQTGEFAEHVRKLRNSPDALSPALILPGFNWWLGHVIEHKTLPRKYLHKFRGDRKMLCVDQNVVSETKLFEQRDTAQEVRPHQKPIIW